MPKKSKIQHDYTCDECGKPATKNIQNNWNEYDIYENGHFQETNTWAGDTNNFYCDECNKKQIDKIN
jgi:hypothetical protein